MDRTPVPPSAHADRSLPRELTEFLIELSVALQKFAIYPLGHPMLATTVQRLEHKLVPLLAERDSLSLGVARHQLVIEGVATEDGHAVLRDLAERLHHHHLGAVKIARGVGADELREMLVAVGTDQDRHALPIGLRPGDQLPQWAHLRLYPLAYEHLELLEEERDVAESAVAARSRADGARAARLWVGLARAALAGHDVEQGTDEGIVAAESATGAHGDGAVAAAAENAAADPAAVARAIDEHRREAAYDQVIVGYLLQIAGELKTADGRDAAVLRSRISRMVGAMKPETLQTLLTMGGDDAQRRRFVLEATQGLAVDAVVELVRAAADASKQTVSHSMLRLLSKLAVHAERDAPARRADADAALRENVRTLVTQWTLDDPNPDAYRAVLEGMSRARPTSIATQPEHPVEEERLFQMALEIGVSGESTWRAMEGMLERRRLSQILSLLEQAPRPNVANQAWDRLATTDRLRGMLAEPMPDWGSLERIMTRLGIAAVDVLLDELEATTDARRQTQIVTLAAKLGNEVGDVVMRRLPRATVEIQAQLLALVGRLPELPENFPATEWVTHRNSGVRREAIKLLLKHPSTREQGVQAGLADADERTVLLALNDAIAHGCPRAAVPVLMNRVDRDDIPGPLRVMAIRTAGSVSSPDVVDWVLRFVMVGRKSFFANERFAPKSPELLAALGVLATHWRHDARSASTLARAAKHADPEIRVAADAQPQPPSRRDAGAGADR